MQFCFRLPFVLSLALITSAAMAHAQPVERPPHLVTGRWGMPAVAIGTDVYVIGGGGPAAVMSDVEKIDTASTPIKITVLHPKLTPRYFDTGVTDGRYIYILGGNTNDADGLAISDLVERLDTKDNSVTTLAPMPVAARTPSAVLIGGKIYVVGGLGEDAERMDALQIYDIATNTWKRGAAMPAAMETDAIAWKGGLLTTGGYDGRAAVTSVYSYDPATDKWTTLPPLPVITSAHHGAVLSDGQQVALFGDYAEMDRVWRGNPGTGEWQKLKETGYTRRRHAAVVRAGDKICVIGGNIQSSGSYLDDIQIFDLKQLETAH